MTTEPPFRLTLGDCIAGMAAMADASVDHVITDPPYESEAHTLQRRVRKGVIDDGNRVLSVEPLDFAPITVDVRSSSGGHFARLSRRWSLVFCQVEAAMKWKEAIPVDYARTCVWVKPDAMPQLTGDRPGMGYESIVACHAPGRKKWNGGGRCGVFTVATKSDPDAMRSGHPTQKPLMLMEMLIELFTDPGDLILDPFMGSGTTGVAAIRLGRRFVGFERDPKYFAIAERRITNAREQLRLIPERTSKPKQGTLLP